MTNNTLERDSVQITKLCERIGKILLSGEAEGKGALAMFAISVLYEIAFPLDGMEINNCIKLTEEFFASVVEAIINKQYQIRRELNWVEKSEETND